MTNGLRNHPRPERIRSWADEQKSKRIHRRFWICYTTAGVVLICVVALWHG